MAGSQAMIEVRLTSRAASVEGHQAVTSNLNARDLFACISKSVGRVKYHQGAKGCEDRLFTRWGLGRVMAVRQASLRAAAPMMTIPLHPRGVKEAAQQWTVRRPAGKPGSPPHATADQRDEVNLLLP